MPEASLVVIGVASPRDRVQVTLRYDLPDPPDADLAADIVAHAVGVLRSQRLTTAIAVGYGPEAPVTPLAGALRAAARAGGVGPRGLRRVFGGPYWAPTRRADAGCPRRGRPLAA